MAFLFRRNKSKNDSSQQSSKSNNNRNVSTRILQINLDEVKQQMDAEDEAKKTSTIKENVTKKEEKG